MPGPPSVPCRRNGSPRIRGFQRGRIPSSFRGRVGERSLPCVLPASADLAGGIQTARALPGIGSATPALTNPPSPNRQDPENPPGTGSDGQSNPSETRDRPRQKIGAEAPGEMIIRKPRAVVHPGTCSSRAERVRVCPSARAGLSGDPAVVRKAPGGEGPVPENRNPPSDCSGPFGSRKRFRSRSSIPHSLTRSCRAAGRPSSRDVQKNPSARPGRRWRPNRPVFHFRAEGGGRRWLNVNGQHHATIRCDEEGDRVSESAGPEQDPQQAVPSHSDDAGGFRRDLQDLDEGWSSAGHPE